MSGVIGGLVGLAVGALIEWRHMPPRTKAQPWMFVPTGSRRDS